MKKLFNFSWLSISYDEIEYDSDDNNKADCNLYNLVR